MNKKRQHSTSSSSPLTGSLSRHNSSSVQTSNMAPSISTVPNSNTRRSTPLSQQNSEKAQNRHAADVKPTTDDSGPKRPKRALKLTTSQRERKRAIDREAQRSIRLKTKNYIAHLENLVKVMEHGGSTTSNGESAHQSDVLSIKEEKNEGAKGLLAQLRQNEEEIRKLKEMLAGVQKLVGTDQTTVEESDFRWLELSNACNNDGAFRLRDHLETSVSVYSHSSDSSSHLVDLGYLPYDQASCTEASAPDYSSKSFGSQPCAAQQQDLYSNVGRLSTPGTKSDRPTSDAVDVPSAQEEGELFLLSEREINRVLAAGHQSFSNQPLDEDIIVRAVLHGWREVQDVYLLDKGWQALRSIDQAIFQKCGIVERMAILYMMRLKLLHQSSKNSQYLLHLPPFFQRSSLEDAEALEKTPLIEHLIWPCLRSRVCKDSKKYRSNKFTDSFRRSFKFLWPFDISDTFIKDYSTQLYSITPDFKQRQWDLGSWTMRRDFFEHASELLGAIPVYEPPMDRLLVSPTSIPLHLARSAAQAPQRMLQRATKTENQEPEGLQMGISLVNSRPPARIPCSMPAQGIPLPSTHNPYSAEVEAWLGDPNMVPQYWNMSPAHTNVSYEAVPQQQWPNIHHIGYGG